ncbi:hypothetical protein JOC85_001001 [Bacillus mesophilus]|uniref:Uncharacterized protein n=1 Tax=Bacillus mesophilus TaxID=1808955 RepID=A0A6M0Q402_9BACI|nr:hypothetical protein [Bacillus mesophilus]MBM7660234.1 hypothetical protein [Bacillus mesophilus]NEY70952.1 hypothetical protein [Bacillus mesophilus]
MNTLIGISSRININKSMPFIFLAIIHFLLLGVTFYKKGNKTFSLLFISIGIGYVFEYFVLNVFKMYKYNPNIFKNKWIDSVFGALLSQSVYIPISATILTMFKLGWKWRIVAASIYGVIERLFIHWGIYKNKTWSTFLTITAMPIYFYIVAKWWDDVLNGERVKIYISIFFGYWISYTNILYFCLVLFKKYRFQIGILKEKYWEHFILVPIYTCISAIIGSVNTIYSSQESKWKGLLVLHAFDRVLFKYKVIKPSTKFNLYSLIPIHLFVLFFGENIKSRLNDYVAIRDNQ